MTILKEMIVRYETDGHTVKGMDAGELIRCRDCKYYDGFDCDRYADETYGISHSTQEYGYCWVAERKDNGKVSND